VTKATVNRTTVSAIPAIILPLETECFNRSTTGKRAKTPEMPRSLLGEEGILKTVKRLPPVSPRRALQKRNLSKSAGLSSEHEEFLERTWPLISVTFTFCSRFLFFPPVYLIRTLSDIEAPEAAFRSFPLSCSPRPHEKKQNIFLKTFHNVAPRHTIACSGNSALRSCVRSQLGCICDCTYSITLR